MKVEDYDAEDFLELVYEDREAWIDLPAKVGHYWVPFHTEWPNEEVVSRRIDSSLRDREDLYYSVAQFANRGRNIEDVLPSQWLWADLDEVHPTSGAGIELMPTVAIQSSPGRYQALWRLTRPLKPKTLEKLNRGLTYALGADLGGWDLTQVLRIPGTRNYKYPEAPVVELLWYHEELEYDPNYVWARVKQAVPANQLAGVAKNILPKRPIPAKARRLLRVSSSEVVAGERSDVLWELECLLAEAGLSAEEIFDLVWVSAWNKWRDVSTGRRRLEREIRKAISHVTRKVGKNRERRTVDDDSVEGAGDGGDPAGDAGDSDDGDSEEPLHLPFVGYASFMAMVMEEPKWLIENIWTASSHGIIGGEPKTSKTTLALAFALSVASGKPFLGNDRYQVGTPGPVLMVQEENAPWMMQDRMRKMAAHLGLISRRDVHARASSRGALGSQSLEIDFPVDLPIRVLNNFGFDLGIEEHRDMLWAEVESIRPKLVILDPLYLILGNADENSSSQLRPFLKWLLALRYEFDTAIAVIHHFRKQTQNGPVVRSGQRVMGSGILHGWVDSAIYASPIEDERQGWIKARYETEFRSMAPQKPIEVGWNLGQPGDLAMEVEVGTYSMEQLLRDMVIEEPGVTVNALASRLGADKRTVLARIRGGELGLYVKDIGKGRGKSHQVFPSAESAGLEPPKGEEEDDA